MDSVNKACAKVIILIANSDGAIYNFRKSLIERLVSLNLKVIVVGGTSLEGDYTSRLSDLGVEKIISLNTVGKLSVLASLVRAIIVVIKLLSRENVAVVHCFTHFGCIAGGIASKLSMRSDSRLVFTLTGLGRLFVKDDASSKISRAVLMFIYKCIDSQVCRYFFQNTDDMEFFTTELGLSSCRREVVGGSGVDLNEFQPSNDNYINLRAPIKVLCLSRGMVEKGFFEFYKVAMRFANQQPGRFEFMHAGNIDRSVSRALGGETIQDFALRHHVKYLGFVTNIKEVLDNANVIVHQSYYREGVPRSLIEALAMDKFIITCDTVGNREVVINVENGFFCEPASEDSLFSAINLVTKTELKKREGISRALAVARFDVKKIDEAVIKSYGDLRV